MLLTLFTPAESGLRQVSPHWWETNACDPVAVALFSRHYSCRGFRLAKIRRQHYRNYRIAGPSEVMTLLGGDARALYVWTRQKPEFRRDGQTGVNCAVFRNEGPVLSSLLIVEACELAWARWPGERLFTYVDPAKVRSANPGYCFKRAGFKACGRSASGKALLERSVSQDEGA